MNSALNSSDSQQTVCSHTIDFEACLFSLCCSNTDLGQKSTALLIQVHNGSLYWGREMQKALISSFQTKSVTHHPALFCFSLISMPCTANALP